ncbi:MAG: hypothetical protein LUE93_17015 [Bacteroides sp.]|nr:hypothetical protein [Bacteroides sp.]
MKRNYTLYILVLFVLLGTASCDGWDLNLDSTKPNYTGKGEAPVIRAQLAAAYSFLLNQHVFGENY